MKNKRWDCIGIGLCVLDRIALLSHYPRANEKTVASDYRVCGGGPVPNEIFTMARLGNKVAIIGKLGLDPEGEIVTNELAEAGVNTDYLLTTKNGRTPTAQIWIDKRNGERTVVLQEKRAPHLSKKDIPVSLIRQSKYLLFDGRDTEVALRSAEIGRRYGVKVVLDLGSMREHLQDLLKSADIVIASESFAQAFDKSASLREICRTIRTYGAEIAVITLGEKGCVWSSEDSDGSMPAFPVEAIDTTGAGDVFHGAFIHGLLGNWGLEKTFRFAQAVSALQCQMLGGRGAVKSERQVWRYIK
jgi:ribokinase